MQQTQLQVGSDACICKKQENYITFQTCTLQQTQLHETVIMYIKTSKNNSDTYFSPIK